MVNSFHFTRSARLSLVFPRRQDRKENHAGSDPVREGPVSDTLPNMADQLSTLYRDLLEGNYDCVDRVVLNAYFSMGQTGGGFRMWWRELHGSDENLDDTHLMRMAGFFGRRLRAWAKPTRSRSYCGNPQRLEEVAHANPETSQEPGLCSSADTRSRVRTPFRDTIDQPQATNVVETVPLGLGLRVDVDVLPGAFI